MYGKTSFDPVADPRGGGGGGDRPPHSWGGFFYFFEGGFLCLGGIFIFVEGDFCKWMAANCDKMVTP